MVFTSKIKIIPFTKKSIISIDYQNFLQISGVNGNQPIILTITFIY